ncbi:MAG: prepilin peptidase [Clostridia bacterium]
MNLYYSILFFIIGLIFGSFFNVLIYRLPKEENFISNRSYCPNCKTQLKFYDLIPIISYISLKGKCRYCNESISIRYPLIELLTGGLFAAAYLKFGLSSYLFLVLFMISLLIVITFIDIDYMIIPHTLTISGIAVFTIWQLFFNQEPISSYLYGLFFGFLFLAVFVFFNAMGGGDAMLAGMFGMFFGFYETFVLLMISFIIGGAFSIIILIFKRKSRKDKIPFGPFLTIAALLMIFFDSFFLSIYGL